MSTIGNVWRTVKGEYAFLYQGLKGKEVKKAFNKTAVQTNFKMAKPNF